MPTATMINPAVTAESQHDTSEQCQAWQSVYQELYRQRDAIIQAIRSYPPPIPACDAQYNYLLEQRTWVLRELKQLTRIAPHDDKALQAFVDASAFLH